MKIHNKYKQNILDPSDFLTQQEAKRLLKAVDTRRFIGRRDKAILLIFLSTGLRKSELISLNVCDYYKENKDYWFEFQAKGGQTHIQSIPTGQTIKALDNYLKIWGIGKDPNAPLFQSSENKRIATGKRLCKHSIEHLLRKYGRLAGIKKRFHVHMLRHTAGSEFYRLTQNLPLTKEFLRHKNINSTLIYMHADKTKVKAAQKLMFK